MGCKQSTIANHIEITKEEAKLIPLIFRDSSKQKLSPGISYWFDTCLVKEGTLPLKIADVEYTVEYVCISKHGFYPMERDRTTQDSYSFMETKFNINGNEKPGIFMGVFDGHGDNGQECSLFCKEYINKKLNQNTSHADINAVASYINSALQECNSQMHEKKKQGGWNDSNSGTTAVCLSVIEDDIICVNVGDSRCMAGYYTLDNCIIPCPLSIDQTPARPDEYRRVVACGAEVCTIRDKLAMNNPQTSSNLNSMNLNSMTFSPEDPPRIYLKNCGYPGAAFSRSIGDSIAESVGVIAEGEVVMKKLEAGVNHIIVASDGLWNLCIPEDLVTNIRYSTDLAKTGVGIVLSTFLRWIHLYGSSDDITLLILKFPEFDRELNADSMDWNAEKQRIVLIDWTCLFEQTLNRIC